MMSQRGEEIQRGHNDVPIEVPDEASGPRSPNHAERCRTLTLGARTGTLCTVAREPEGFPYGSLVTLAFDLRGRPLMLLSTLAEHTQNLLVREDASVLVTEPLEQHPQPLALGRVTLLGPCKLVDESELAEVRATFLAAHPDATSYVDFSDFAFYRLEPVALRYVGGFGRMSWVGADDYRVAQPDPLAGAAAVRIVTHMNDDHADALIAYARAFAGLLNATAATMTAVDRYGFELSVTTPDGVKSTRLAFETPVTNTDEARKAMVSLVKEARARLS